MRTTARFFATVRSAARFLEPNTPTGLTGLTTHPAPRPSLIYTYRQTLNKLALFPESSVYRQSTEAITKHRLAIVEAEKPGGYESWLERVKKQIEASPAAYGKFMNEDGTFSSMKLFEEKSISWDGELSRLDSHVEGANSAVEAERKADAVRDELAKVEKEDKEGVLPTVEELEVEPPLSLAQIEDIENKIGAGLIEEVLQVAEGELELVDEMLASKVWEPLEEKIPPGQWEYFERGNPA